MDLIGRYTDCSTVRFTSSVVILVSVIVLLLIFLGADDKPTIFGINKGSDYAGLYLAGKILNDHGIHRLYDAVLQDEVYHGMFPYLPANVSRPNPYPPFFNALFMPLALLPYSYSYGLWLTITLFLYVAGLTLVLKKTPSFSAQDKVTIYLLALSFEPFIMECWIGGQTSAFGFFFVALAVYFLMSEKPIMAGLALGPCLYKPPLLLLLLPYAFLRRKRDIAVGFLLSAIIILTCTVALFGNSSLIDWFNFAFRHVGAQTGHHEVLATYKFVDLVSFVRLLFGSTDYAYQPFLVLIPVLWLLYIFIFVKIHKANTAYKTRLNFSSIIIWTTAVNIYFPIYDTVLVVICLILVIDTIHDQEEPIGDVLSKQLKYILLPFYLVPWISGAFAKAYGIQLFTVVLVGLGIYIDLMSTRAMGFFSKIN